MKIPIYTEVSFEGLNQLDLGDIRKALQKAKVGVLPSYIVTHHFAQAELFSFLTLLAQALDELKMTERFPYPLYIISTQMVSHSRFFIAPNVESLPVHFFKKVKRLKPKEQLLLSKIVVMGEKIVNVNLVSKLASVKKQAKLNRELANVCHELNSYDLMLEQLKDSKN